MTIGHDRAFAVRAEELGAAAISASQRFHVSAEGYSEPFQIDVASPVMPVPPGQRLPVVYVLDGNWSFSMVTQTVRLLQLGPAGLPPLIVVGIGCALDGPAGFGRTAALRYRDLVPSVDEAHIASMKAALPASLWPAEAELGQAARFSRFIEGELKPFIESRFPVDTENQTLLGVSLGGLFVLNTLFGSPGAYSRHIAISPSIWWNDCAVLEAEARAATASDLKSRLFLGVGEMEEAQAPEARMVSNLVHLAARLEARSFPGLRLSSHVFPGEGHLSVPPAAICRGLRAVFAPWFLEP